MSNVPPSSQGLRQRLKSVLPSRSRDKRPDAGTSKNTPTAPTGTTAGPLGLSSTAVQKPDTNAARTSSKNVSQVAPNPEPPVHKPEFVASKTPLWDQAVSDFRYQRKDEYEKLKLPAGKVEYEELGLSEGGIEFENSILNKELPEAFQEEAGHSNHASIRRLKSWLPALGAAKGLAMTLARLDPNQLAPYIVAGSFFAVEVGSIFCTPYCDPFKMCTHKALVPASCHTCGPKGSNIRYHM